MGERYEVATAPMTAEAMHARLMSNFPHIAAVFGAEGEGLEWGGPERGTGVVSESAKGRLLEDSDYVRCKNAHRSFSFTRSSRYYEGQPYLWTYFVLSMITSPVIGFGLTATERPGELITRATFEKCIIYEAHAEALLALFKRLLSEGSGGPDHS